jgi:hypothetical protein
MYDSSEFSQVVMHWTFIQEVPALSLSQGISYPYDFSLFPIFPSVKWNNILNYVMNTSKHFPLIHFTIYNHPFLYFNADNCAVERASLSRLSVLSNLMCVWYILGVDQLLLSWNKTLCISVIPQIVDNVQHNILIMNPPLSESFRETYQFFSNIHSLNQRYLTYWSTADEALLSKLINKLLCKGSAAHWTLWESSVMLPSKMTFLHLKTECYICHIIV